jgi:predicted nucleotidyltransferase
MVVDLIINRVVEALNSIDGIDAIVLGGSRAKGNYTAKSDIDVGIYYTNGDLLDLEELDRVATELDDEHRHNLITKIGEWGPWINGGGWLCIDGYAVDLLLRDMTKVNDVIEDCLHKRITIDYQPGHPHGFVNSIYVAETYYCKILWERDKVITRLKDKLTPYPVPLKTGIIDKFLWEAGFTKELAYKGLQKDDIVYASGCIYRVIACLTQVLYALNETYIMNEKGSLKGMEAFVNLPEDFRKRVETISCSLEVNNHGNQARLDELSGIIKEVEELCDQYR